MLAETTSHGSLARAHSKAVAQSQLQESAGNQQALPQLSSAADLMPLL